MDHIVNLLIQYKYLLIFPLAIVEGPIIAVIAGFLCTSGFLNPYLVFPIIVIGDLIGDTICYLLGRWGVPKFIKRFSYRFGLSNEKIDRARLFFDSNPNATISISKITLGIGVAGIYIAGNVGVPYKKFIRICLVTSFLQYVIYLSIGLLFGHAYIRINHYLNYFASFSIITVLAFIVFISIRTAFKKI
jgi:membrane protein DedA with SNARE-associated domain